MPALTPSQKLVFDQVLQFLKSDVQRAFVLRGYAGTGKTFLMQHLARYLTDHTDGYPSFELLASTGRAAAVLRGKTGFEAKTVHSALYAFASVEGDSEAIDDNADIDQFGQMTLRFDMRPASEESIVYIVDEASMLSSEHTDKTSFAQFGTGRLLHDLLHNLPKGKFIFVGDPCQLPPIGQALSPALSPEWLRKLGVPTGEASLSEIMRTRQDNDILIVASGIRRMIEEPSPYLVKWPKIPAMRRESVQVTDTETDLFEAYWQAISQNRSCIAISNSNAQCHKINERIRASRYGNAHSPLQKGDKLLVTQNNYLVPLTNGDFIVVKAIGERQHHCNLVFVSVQVGSEMTGDEHEILLIEDLLTHRLSNITSENHRALMIAYSRSCRRAGIKPNSQLYKEGMMKDPFLNALRATYGYAVTCHKAQGGEWDDVFLFLHKGMYAMEQPDMFRWWYTAITRARERVYLHHDWWLS